MEIFRLISNLTDGNIQCPVPIPENEGSELLANELNDGNGPCGSFCTSIKVEESTPKVSDDTTGIEENVMVQNYEVLIETEIQNHVENTNTFQDSEHLPNMQISLNEIQRDQDDMAQHDGILNFLSSRKKLNCVWVEIDNMRQQMEDRNLNIDYLNIPEKEPIENTIKNLEDGNEALISSQSEDMGLDVQEGESSNALLTDNDLSECTESEKALENIHETPDPLSPEIEETLSPEVVETLSPEIVGTLSPETGEIVHSEAGEPLLSEEEMRMEKTQQSCIDSSEDISIGDSKKSAAETQSDAKSDVSSELELGIRNFGIRSVREERSKDGKSEKKSEAKKKPMKSKISRYIGSTTIPKPKKEKPNKPQKTVMESNFTRPIEESKPAEVQLQPVTYDEITNTQPLLNNDRQDETLPKFTEIHDELSEMSKVPGEMSDKGSACSDDSWDSWLGKFVSIMRSKSPVREAPFTPKSDIEKEEDLCDCVNSHRCLRAVDSEEEVSRDLLSAEQLRSVETGSVSDWLYRVNPPNPLL
jgi:hypothetical protein